MSIGVFSDFRTTAPNHVNPAVKENTQQNQVAFSSQTKQKTFTESAKEWAPVVLPLVTIPITACITYKLSTKGVDKLKGQVSTLTEKINGMSGELAKAREAASSIEGIKAAQETAQSALDAALKTNRKLNAGIWSALIAAAGLSLKPKDMADKDAREQVRTSLATRLNNMENSANTAQRVAHDANVHAQQSLGLSGNSLMTKYTRNYHGIQLLTNNDSLNKNEQKYQAALETIKNAAPKYLHTEIKANPLSTDSTIWSVTSEFAPIKEGGLGSVPVEIQNNVSKLGIDIPTFIPMYQQKGIASFRQDGQTYTYKHKNAEFKLQKAATFKMDTFQGGKSKTEDVEIYISTEKDGKKTNPLVFVKNDTYFNGTIYQTCEKSEEPEKFAFFSKAVYEFAKAKMSPENVKGLNIIDHKAYDSIKAPDTFILNDWQASPIAALARYKAPMENAYSQLSDKDAKKLSDMTIIAIGHNTMYQGSTRLNNNDVQRNQSSSNILNTLFDNFASDIVENATTGATEMNPKDKGLKNLDNVLVLNGISDVSNSLYHVNLLNMGVCLSNYFHPVSENYAKEIISDDHPDLADELRWALNQKNDAGTLVGIINGNDLNNLSIEAKKATIKKQTGLDFQTYNKESNIDDVMKARLSNKINFYNNFILPFSKINDKSNTSPEVEAVRALTGRLEFVDKSGKMTMPVLTDEELEETPIITSVGRLVSQKGIPVMTEAIGKLMKNWDSEFPGRPKPIFYLAGQDGEGGTQRAHIEKLKADLPKVDSDRILFAHGFAPMTALTAGADYFLLPSIFEPCGLTQGEAFAVATPVIGSAVGGIVDTVNRNGKKNGILTDKTKPLTADGFYKAMVEGLKTYFTDKDTYKSMVKDSLAEDFSWIQKGKQGPVFDYLEKIGFDRKELPEVC